MRTQVTAKTIFFRCECTTACLKCSKQLQKRSEYKIDNKPDVVKPVAIESKPEAGGTVAPSGGSIVDKPKVAEVRVPRRVCPHPTSPRAVACVQL